ncbi:hypothetical protein KFE25_012496 [Diacronema lutheri]|uniref:PARP-type domain-containing protein n=2 Tax=Diacronema lutheri TaxID=2081491 RepID=A0A8J5XIK5_DIALT|nr:hypothetical protein KFE25_012496 [Diacronema lutheri]
MSRSVEYAKSGRSSCKKCKVKIAKDELRVGVVTVNEDVEMTSWFHPQCAQKKRGVEMTPSEFAGYDELRPEDRATIDQLCSGELAASNSAKKPRVSSDAPPTDDPNSEHPGYAAAYAKYVALPIPVLKAYLGANDQLKGGAKAALVSQCVDGELHGALPRCPLCEFGRLKTAEGTKHMLVCPGHFSESARVWRTCGYKAEAAKASRLPWRTAEEGPRAVEAEPAAAGGAQLDAAQFDGLSPQAAADRLVSVAREAGATLSADETTARIAAGTALNASRDEEGKPEPAKALRELLAKYPPKRTAKMEASHPANSTIVALLKEYADLMEKLGENVHGVNGTRKANVAIMALEYEITSGKALAAAKTKVEGVGASTASKIDEILTTGTFAKLEEMRARAAAL